MAALASLPRRAPRSCCVFVTLALGWNAAPLLAAEVATTNRPPWVSTAAPPSAALERMLRDRRAAGDPVPAELVKRWHLDLREDGEGSGIGAAPSLRFDPGATTIAQAPDRRVNDPSGDVPCASCHAEIPFSPLGQAEATIAAWGNFLLVGWNNARGTCQGSAVQGYGYSTDRGLTWTDGGDVPPHPTGGRWRGDPVHAVNRATGEFYLSGLYEGGALGSGIAMARGHFAGGTFVFDDNRQILVGGQDVLDKEWIACDPMPGGNLYVTYTRFRPLQANRIELVRSTDNGLTWSSPLPINAPNADGGVQGSRPLVGPDGEVYVAWYENGYPQSQMKVRRSNNGGVSFGPEGVAATFCENGYSGAPGFRRGLGIAWPSLAVDRSNGPHRGRLYVAWDESVNHTDTPLVVGTLITETESSSFAQATPFTVGQSIRGTLGDPADVDLFRFAGLRGQTVQLATDQSGGAIAMRLACATDTSSLASVRFLAYRLAAFPAVVFTLPADGTYYVRLNRLDTDPFETPYRVLSAFDSPSPGDRARDHRDRFVSHSDGGLIWSPPVRLNDDDPWFDGVFPEVVVDDQGDVHCYWHDFRDDPICGAHSQEYMTSSGDGGVTWGPNRRVSDQSSFWSLAACGNANQGDYQGIASEGQFVYPAWADARLGDPDVFAEATDFSTGRLCPTEQSVTGGAEPLLTFRLVNTGNTAGAFEWSVHDDNGWLQTVTPPAGTQAALAPGAFQEVQVRLAVNGACLPSATDVVRFVTRDLRIPGKADTCATTVRCSTPIAATPEKPVLALAAPRPNPAGEESRIDFSLTRGGRARLAVFGADGRRLRVLADGRLDPGRHTRVWDGRDTAGRRAAPGVYFVRLEAEDRTLEHKLSVMR
jgi:hypothetical protein